MSGPELYGRYRNLLALLGNCECDSWFDLTAMDREVWDALAGDDLQTSPLAWQQRRELLGHVAALEEIVARMRMASEIRASLVAQREADRAAQREETGHPMMCGCSECM